jgi:hypothetical protein
VNPPDNLPVIATPIYASGRCNIPAQPDDLGSYKANAGDHDRHGETDNSGGDN